jgi:DNA polymerase I
MVSKKAMLIDVDYTVRDGKLAVRLLLKGEKGFFRLYDRYEPYFYLDAPEEKIEEIMKFEADAKEGKARATRAEPAERILMGERKKLLKVTCTYPFHVPVLREGFRKWDAYEHRIPFARRYMIDKGLVPFSLLTYEREGKYLKGILGSEEGKFDLRAMAFDIETYNPLGSPRPDKDPVIMISYANGKSGVLTYKEVKRPFATVLADEKGIIDAFCRIVKEEDVELLIGYNSAAFDLPYLKKRADVLRTRLPLGRDGSSFKERTMGLLKVARIAGRIHVDLYPAVRFLGTIGAFKISRYTLENAYEEITEKKKKMVPKLSIWEMWENTEERNELADYSLHDAEATKEVADVILPIEVEMSRITKTPLFDVCNATTGQLVESLLMRASFERGEVIPNRPSESEVRKRAATMIKGAFVKMPTPGVYEKLAVFDFRSLYPSIITSHNVDPYTLNKGRREDGFVSPHGTWFRREPRGLIPSVLDDLMEKRKGIKEKLKGLRKDSEEYRMLFARSQSLKILMNSFYGYLAFARSRWYSMDCGESVTAWGRKYVQDTMKKAEEHGFEVLYADTDSIFLVLGDKRKEDALSFMEKINKELPEKMELELEGFYPRGVFVAKKVGVKGAKKKYALIGEDGRIKIRGFELVRRDWAKIAKDTQMAVLKAILEEGSREKAVEVVRSVIEKIKKGEIDIKDMVIYTQLRKSPMEYEIVSPELSAAKKGIERGTAFEKGSVVGYVITRSGGSISEKAEIAEYAKDYDPAYYIDHQVLPSVMKILKELGYTEDDLKFRGTQKNLGSFFE